MQLFSRNNYQKLMTETLKVLDKACLQNKRTMKISNRSEIDYQEVFEMN